MTIGKRLLTATILFGLSLAASGQPGVDKQPLEVHLGEALSLQEVAELLEDPSFLSQQVEQWRNAGYPDIPIEGLPSEVRELVDTKEGVIPPEVFFTVEVQKALLDATRDASEWDGEGGPDIPVDALPKEVREDLGLSDGAIPPEVFYSARMQEALAEHLGPVALGEPGEIVVNASDLNITMEEVQQMVRRELGPGAVVVTSPDILRAFDDHAGDEAALRQAIEAAIPSLPPEMRQSLQWGFQIEMEDVDLPLRKKKRGLEPGQLPTEEVLRRVSPEARTALADHRELLDDRWALIRALPDMPERTRRAAEEFLGKATEPVPAASMLPDDALREIERAKERGYFEKPGAPFGTQLLATIYQSELAANQAATGHHHAPSVPKGRKFYSRLEDHIAIHPMLPTVPAHYVEAGSRNYVVPSKDSSSQIYSKSVFGPRLHVQEYDAVGFSPYIPNLTIAGNDGTVILEKHESDAWATTVSGFNGRKIFRITVEAKLEGELRDRFVAMATAIIEGGYGF